MFLYLELAALDSNIFIPLNVIFVLFLPVASCYVRDKQLACLLDLLKQDSACRLGFLYFICCELLSVIYERADLHRYQHRITKSFSSVMMYFKRLWKYFNACQMSLQGWIYLSRMKRQHSRVCPSL